MRSLPITGEYPADWPEIADRVRAEAGHRCIRCGHPYRVGEHGKGEWSPCDERCTHGGPIGLLFPDGAVMPALEGTKIHFDPDKGLRIAAQWRILTVHHFDGNKANCVWWNLLSLCQVCHLKIQSRVNPEQPYMFEHSDWLKPYVAGFYAFKYEGRQVTRDQAVAEMDRLLALERIA